MFWPNFNSLNWNTSACVIGSMITEGSNIGDAGVKKMMEKEWAELKTIRLCNLYDIQMRMTLEMEAWRFSSHDAPKNWRSLV